MEPLGQELPTSRSSTAHRLRRIPIDLSIIEQLEQLTNQWQGRRVVPDQ